MTTGRSQVQRRRRRIGRALLVVLAIVVLAPLAAIAAFVLRFNPNAYKPEIAAAVEKATGRRLTLDGPLSLGLSLQPTIAAANVALANPPGFSAPEMATLARLDAKVALLPLLSGRIEMRRLVLVRPDIAIEIDRAGTSNLSFGHEPATPGPAGGQAVAPSGARAPGPARAARPVAIDVSALSIEDGRISWRDDRSGRHGLLLLRSFAARSGAPGGPVAITANADYAGVPFTLTGTTGPLSRLTMPLTGPSWPVQLAVAAGPMRLSLTGGMTDPAAGHGYDFEVHAELPALEQLAPLLPGTKLPALHGIVLSADLSDAGHGLSEVSNLSLAAGASDLAALRRGLTLASLSLTAPRLDQPCKLTVAGALSGTPLTLAATLGPPVALLPAGFAPPAPAAPWPVAVHATAAGADFSLSGTIARPAVLAGANLAASAQIPELAKLGPFAGRSLPAVSQITLSGQIADAEAGWRHWVRLSALSLSLPQGDLAGDATLTLAGPRPTLTAALTAKRIDLDALRKAVAGARGAPAGQAATPAHGAPPPAAPVPAARGSARLIPDTPIPFAILKTIDADISFGVGSLRVGGTAYRNVAGKMSVKDGRLQLAPFGADAPGGHVALALSADAAQSTPPVAMTVDAPALALAPLLSSFGLPAAASGTLAVRAALESSGSTPQAIAAGLNGRLGMAMAGGSVDNRAVGQLFGSVFRAAHVPPELFGKGTRAVQCLALRIDATHGIGAVQAGLLEMSGLTLVGTGSLALGPESLALTLDPTVRYGNNALSLPVRVGGTFMAPKLEPEAGEAARSAAGLAGNFVKPQSALGQLLGALRGNAAPTPPACAPALALARFGEPGPPAPAAPSGRAPSAKPNNPLNLLQGLFRR